MNRDDESLCRSAQNVDFLHTAYRLIPVPGGGTWNTSPHLTVTRISTKDTAPRAASTLNSLINTSMSLKYLPMLEKLCCPWLWNSRIQKDTGPRMPPALPPQPQELPEQQSNETSTSSAGPAPLLELQHIARAAPSSSSTVGGTSLPLPLPPPSHRAMAGTPLPLPPLPTQPWQ